jgi:glucose-6-phosphate isomerase
MPSYRRRRRRETTPVRIDLNGLLAGVAGADGLDPAELESLSPELLRVREQQRSGAAAAVTLPSRDDVRHTVTLATELRDRFTTIVVLGARGAAPATTALAAAFPAGGPRLVVADSIDPEAVEGWLAGLDLQHTLIDVVSPSGDPTTMAQFLIVRDRLLRELGAVDYRDHVIVTTDAEHGPLRQIVNDEGFRDLALPAGAARPPGALTAAGLLPAAIAGVDIEELLAGAAAIAERAGDSESPLADPVLLLGGALWLMTTRRQKRLAVLPGCSRLAPTIERLRALWREHTGQALDVAGPLPLCPGELGDAAVLFLGVESHAASVDVPACYQDLDDVSYLGGHSLGAVVTATQQATEIMLARHRRPSATITLPAVNAATMGQLLYLIEATPLTVAALAGRSPLAAEGEEEMRRLESGLLGRPGFDVERGEAEAWVARKDPRFVL